MFVFVTKRFLVRSFFFSLPNMIRRAEKPDLYATRATLEYLQLIILTMTTVYRPWFTKVLLWFQRAYWGHRILIKSNENLVYEWKSTISGWKNNIDGKNRKNVYKLNWIPLNWDWELRSKKNNNKYCWVLTRSILFKAYFIFLFLLFLKLSSY